MALMSGDIPHIASSTYSGTAYGLGAQGLVSTAGTAGIGPMFQSTGNLGLRRMVTDKTEEWDLTGGRVLHDGDQFIIQGKAEEIDMATSTNRFVRVLIVDPNENIPLDKRIIYKGEEKFTDLNDQELFFEIDIKALLEAHNATRITLRDKKVKEREELLEPAKIRDLKMVVVNIASF